MSLLEQFYNIDEIEEIESLEEYLSTQERECPVYVTLPTHLL